MKMYSLLLGVLVITQSMVQGQIIMANTNRMNTEPDVREPVKAAVAFKLINFSSIDFPVSDVENDMTTLNLTVKEFDLSNNTKGYTFIVPETGIYHLDIHVNFTYPLSDYLKYLRFYLMLCKDGGTVLEKSYLTNQHTEEAPYSPFHTLSISSTQLLNAGEEIYASYQVYGNLGALPVKALQASFSGFKISA